MGQARGPVDVHFAPIYDALTAKYGSIQEATKAMTDFCKRMAQQDRDPTVADLLGFHDSITWLKMKKKKKQQSFQSCKDPQGSLRAAEHTGLFEGNGEWFFTSQGV